MEATRKMLAEKINEAVKSESAGDFVVAKLQLVVHFLAEKLDQFLPPETRSQTLHHWAHLGLTVALPIALVLLCLYCCCCGGEIRLGACLRRCFCCCCSKPEPDDDDGIDYEALNLAMMRAPGRSGALMPRGLFEGNPRGYFRDLRAKKDLPNFYY